MNVKRKHGYVQKLHKIGVSGLQSVGSNPQP